jgi:hypothetical protein
MLLNRRLMPIAGMASLVLWRFSFFSINIIHFPIQDIRHPSSGLDA